MSAHRRFAPLLLAGACALAIACDDDGSHLLPGSTTSSSTTLFFSSVTETTVPPPSTDIEDRLSAVATFSLVDAVTLGALQFDVGYGEVSGRFVGVGARAACVGLISGVITVHKNDTDDKTLRVSMISLGGFDGPADVVRCELVYSDAAPPAADFDLEVVDATAPDLTAVLPEPRVEITVEPLGR